MGDDDHGALVGLERPDDPEHLAGELRVQGGGGLVKAEDVRLQRQRPGDGHALLLAAGELPGIVLHAVLQAHLLEQRLGLRLDPLPHGPLVGLVFRGLLRQQLHRQHHVFESRVLGEQVEGLEHQPEVQPLAAHLLVPLGGGVGGIEKLFAVDPDAAAVGPLQEIQAPQQRGLTAARGADDGQRLPLLHGEGDVLQHLHIAEALSDVRYFQYSHALTPYNSPICAPPSRTAGSEARCRSDSTRP